MKLWYISVADNNGPVGVMLSYGDTMRKAVQKAKLTHGLPKGEVAVFEVDQQLVSQFQFPVDQLMTPEQVEQCFGPCTVQSNPEHWDAVVSEEDFDAIGNCPCDECTGDDDDDGMIAL